MSKETARAFIEKTLTDPALQDRMAALQENDFNGLLHLAASVGYFLDAKDLRSILETSDELGESELEQVAGGLNPQPLPPKIGNAFVKLNPGLVNGIIVIGGRSH